MRVSVRLLLTEDCNLRCVFCHNEGQPGTTKYLTVSDGSLITNILCDANIGSSLQVKLSGGEPTLHPRFGRILQACIEAPCDEIVVITNAVDLGPLRPFLQDSKIRLSINVPAATRDDYYRLTKGSFYDLTDNLKLLRENAVSMSLNSYWPKHRKAQYLDGLVSLADGIPLKLLLPCQLTEAQPRVPIIDALSSRLLDRGFHLDAAEYHWSRYRRGSQFVRVQEPWCPQYCREASGAMGTVRITARGLIRGCLDNDLKHFGSIYADPTVRRNSIRSALESVGSDCGDTMSVRVLKRKRLA